jgi:MFS transporter, DHA2 family, methylenomycin A resistance protein
MVSSSLAILNDACAHDSRLRARAIGIWTAAGGVALAGQALAIVALTALIGAIIEARPLGLTHPIVAAGSLLALAAGAAFIAV